MKAAAVSRQHRHQKQQIQGRNTIKTVVLTRQQKQDSSSSNAATLSVLQEYQGKIIIKAAAVAEQQQRSSCTVFASMVSQGGGCICLLGIATDELESALRPILLSRLPATQSNDDHMTGRITCHDRQVRDALL